jgi:hypothetical protein
MDAAFPFYTGTEGEGFRKLESHGLLRVNRAEAGFTVR